MLRHPRDSMLSVVAIGAIGAILVNGLFLQTGPHPAPIFALRPLPVAEGPTGAVPAAPVAEPIAPQADPQTGRSRMQVTTDVQRELQRRGYYDGTVDGAYGAKTDAAIRDFEVTNDLKATGEPSDVLLQKILKAPSKPQVAQRPTRPDPIAELLAPSKQVLAVQRALSDYGFGPVAVNGVYGPETRAAIERFERNHRMPVTGQISDRLTRELASLTGRPL